MNGGTFKENENQKVNFPYNPDKRNFSEIRKWSLENWTLGGYSEYRMSRSITLSYEADNT